MSYYKTSWDTHLTVDASPVGLGAILWQSDPEDDCKVVLVSTASKTLTDTESRYSQFEKEGYAAVWGCEKFHMYLYGCKFQLHTDNKGVEMILNNPKSNPGARMKRWVLRLTQYNFTVHHIAGKNNISDYISRLCQGSCPKSSTAERATENFVNLTVQMSKPRAFTLDELVKATNEDEELTQLKYALVRGHFLNHEVAGKRFSKVLNECCTTSDDQDARTPMGVLACRLQRSSSRW